MFHTLPSRRRWRTAGLTAVSAFLLLAKPAAAQMSLYSFQNQPGTYTPLSGATQVVVPVNGGGGDADDGYSLPVLLPFPFQFGTQSYTSVTLTTNGYVGLGTHTVGNNYNVFNSVGPNPSEDNVVAFANVDLEGTAGLGTQYSVQTTGTAPNRIYKVEAKNFQRFNGVGGPGQTGSAQVWFYEGSNDIEIHYGTFSALWEPSFSDFRVGLRGSSATDIKSVGGATWTAPVAGTDPTATMNINGAQGILPAPGQTFRFAFPNGQDLTPPVIGVVGLTPPGGACTAQAHVVSVTPTDASGIASAQVTYTVNGGSPQTLAMTNAAGTWRATIPAQGTSYVTYTVTVTDASPLANQSVSPIASYTDVPAQVSAGANQTINAGQAAVLAATTPTAAALKISEVVLSGTTTGATTPRPAYIPANEDDFVEISNTGAFTMNLAGYGFEVRSSSTLAVRTYTFPAAAVLPAHGVLVLHLGPGTDDAANRYFHTGGFNDALSSVSNAGLILTAPAGDVVDAIALNGYTFTSTVTTADWNAVPAIGSTTSTAGATLRGADQNTGANWVVASAAQPQTLGAYNTELPDDATRPQITWTGGVLTSAATANPLTTPVHPTPGTFTYTATYTANGCTATDQVVVTVVTPVTPVADFSASTTTPSTTTVVTLTDLSTNRPNSWNWSFSPNTVTFVNGTSATSQHPQVTFNAAGCYTVALTATNGAGANTRTKAGYVCAALQYCTTNLQQNACTSFGNYINTVSIAGTALNNAGTGCNGTLSYMAWPASGATTATLVAGQQYALAVTTNSVGTTAAWLDGNANGQLEATEFILVQASGPPNQPATVQFTVPAGTPGGQVLLRIRNSGLSNSISAGDACVLRFSGETEDYTVTLQAGCNLATPTLTSNGPLCAGQTLTLSAANVATGSTYAWTGPNGFTSAAVAPTIANATTAASGTYSLTITNAGCTATATVAVTVNDTPAQPTGTGSSRCGAGTLTLSASGAPAGGTYHWYPSPGSTVLLGTGSPFTTPSQAGLVTYYVAAVSAAGCEGPRRAVVATAYNNPTPTITAGGPTALCQGGSVTLTASGGTATATYQWRRNNANIAGATGPTYTTAQAGAYTVRANNGSGCSMISTVIINVTVGLPASAAFAYGRPNYCLGSPNPTPAVTGSAGGTFSADPAGLVIDPATGQVDLATSAVGSYTVTYSVGSACGSASDTQTLTVTAAPTASVTPAGTATVCQGDSLLLTASAGTAYLWSTGATTASIRVRAAGSYSVTVTNASGCQATSAPVAVTVTPRASAAFGYGTTAYCLSGGTNPTATVTGAAGGNFSATPVGLGLDATTGTIDLIASLPGTYTVTYTVGGACGAAATQAVTIEAPAQATFVYLTPTGCAGSTGTLTPVPAPGTTLGTFSATPAGLTLDAATGTVDLSTSQPGRYAVRNTVAGTTVCGAVSATDSVFVVALPTVAISGLLTSYCTSSPAVTLAGTINGAPVTIGFTVDGTAATQLTPATLAPGTHSVVLTGTNGGCPATATATVTILAAPAQPTITVAVQGSGIVLLTSSSPTGNQWFLNGTAIPGATGATYAVTTGAQSGPYTVVVTGGTCDSPVSAATAVTVTGTAASVAPAAVQLFPNPTTDGLVTVELAATATSTPLTVLDAAGRVVFRTELAARQTSTVLDLHALPAGVYAVRVGVTVRRLVRE